MSNFESQTRKWIEEIVIGLGLCPFAAKVYFEDRINFKVGSVLEPAELFSQFNEEIQGIVDGACDTSIIILNDDPEDFQDYLDLLEVLRNTLKKDELNEKVQLASFHPKFQFENADPNDIENYTNRSPFPLIHILKVEDVAQAIENHPDIHSVSVKNIETLKKLGMQGLLKLMSH